MDEEYDYLIKIVMVGDSGVGKTNLLSRFSVNKFEENTRNTIGVDFTAVDLKIQEKSVKAQFWDTAGQEKYRSIASAYYKNAQGVIMVYDLTRRDTFEHIQNWWEELKEQGDPNIKMIMVGNKADLIEERVVTTEEASSLAKQKDIFFMEVSAKTNFNDCVKTAFLTLLEQIVESEEIKMKESRIYELDAQSDRMKPRNNEDYGKVTTEGKTCC